MEKIKELTEKIFHEGVEKGQAEAQRIIEEAQAEAQEIVSQARQQAQAIEAQGKKKAAETELNTKNELQLYTQQALNALKSEIANVLTDQVVKESVGKLADDTDFLGEFAVTLAKNWNQDEELVISTEKAKQLRGYFAQKAKELLDKGLTIKEVNGHATLFSIGPADGSYKVNFGKEEFENYFRQFLRPQLLEMLFSN